jgi:hypothetical protein
VGLRSGAGVLCLAVGAVSACIVYIL